jgi:hypothetical protein
MINLHLAEAEPISYPILKLPTLYNSRLATLNPTVSLVPLLMNRKDDSPQRSQVLGVRLRVFEIILWSIDTANSSDLVST